MKTLIYYAAILLPLAILFYAGYAGINSYAFVSGLAVYVLIYRPLIDYYRVKTKGYETGIGKLFNPFSFYHIRLFKQLYW